MKKISIIIPVYNCEKTLPRCIESLLDQTYPCREILLVDDGSTDSSYKLCEYYSRKYPDILCFQIPHGGVSAARNYGISQAAGEYLAFVDSDDYVDSHIYETMINNIIIHNSKMCLCGYYTEKAGIQSRITKNYPTTLSPREVLSLMFSEDIIGGFVWNKVYTRQCLDFMHFDSGLSLCEDLVLNTRLLLALPGTISYVDECLYHYVLSDSSATNTTKYFTRTDEHTSRFIYEPAFDRIKKLINESPDTTDFHSLCFLVSKKYADILKYTMYCLITSPSKDARQIRQLKKLMKKESIPVLKNPFLSFRQKLRYFMLSFCPAIYGKRLISKKP